MEDLSTPISNHVRWHTSIDAFADNNHDWASGWRDILYAYDGPKPVQNKRDDSTGCYCLRDHNPSNTCNLPDCDLSSTL